MQVDFILTQMGVTLTYDGNIITLANSDHRYSRVIAALKAEDYESIPNLVDAEKSFNEGDYELRDGIIHIKGKAISEELTDKVLAFKRDNLPTDYLLKFAEKIQDNPSFNSRKMLYKFLEHNGHPITKDGNFIAYRKVNLDFKDLHTGKMDNSVGSTVEMARHLVDDNPDNTCSSGLHVASYSYAKGFGTGHLLEVEIDPKDVVVVPKDYYGTKMRVCKFKVRAICESILESEVYGDEETQELFYRCGELVELGDNVLYNGHAYKITLIATKEGTVDLNDGTICDVDIEELELY